MAGSLHRGSVKLSVPGQHPGPGGLVGPGGGSVGVGPGPEPSSTSLRIRVNDGLSMMAHLVT